MPEAKPAAAPPATAPAADAFDLTVDEFCARRSRIDGRIELIAAFRADQVARGAVKASEDAFERRLSAFANRPA